MNDSSYEKSIFDTLYSVIIKIEEIILVGSGFIKNISPELLGHRAFV